MRPTLDEFVHAARCQVGLDYIACSVPLWTPSGGNADGLVEYAARRAGIVLPLGAIELRANLHGYLTISEAMQQITLVFEDFADHRRQRHVAITDGYGAIIEAMPNIGVRVIPMSAERHWTSAVRL